MGAWEVLPVPAEPGTLLLFGTALLPGLERVIQRRFAAVAADVLRR